MKLRTGKSSYPMPPYSEVLSVLLVLERDQCLFPLCHVRLEDFLPAKRKARGLRGRPVHFAMAGQRILLWPAPDAPMELKVRYHPPVQEA